MIIVSIADQMLYHRRQMGVSYAYPISTATAGTGNVHNSFKTPLGRHRIYAKIGTGLPILTAFEGRVPVDIYNQARDDPARDWILTRILWLEGMTTEKNKRGQVDTKSRFIYIHGTHEENKIGTVASHGCIRMHNIDILEMFDHTHIGETVRIYE